MAYAPAVWLAAQEHLFRTGHYKPETFETNRDTPRLLYKFDESFLFNNIHLSRTCLSFVVDFVGMRLRNEYPQLKDTKQVDAMVLVALHFYAKGILSKKIMDLLGLDSSAAAEAVGNVSKLLAGMNDKFISFPGSHNDRVFIAQRIKDMTKIPNAVGILGCMHVKVTPPVEEMTSYKNYLDYHSVMVQTICDVDGNLLSVEKFSPGRTPEQQLWEGSAISQDFKKGRCGLTWVIGGRGYNSHSNILTPKNPAAVRTAACTAYNEAHHLALACSQRALGSIKTRFQCLNNLGPVNTSSLDHVARIIYACCVLHNIAKKFSVSLPGELVLEPLQPVPYAVEHDDGSAAVSEVIREDVIQTCFSNLSEDPKEPSDADKGEDVEMTQGLGVSERLGVTEVLALEEVVPETLNGSKSQMSL